MYTLHNYFANHLEDLKHISKTHVLTIIPARSGSKGLGHKNIKLLGGKPLLAYSIEAALNASLTDRIIVMTDDDKYAAIARSHGAEVPFLEPADLASDQANIINAIYYLQQVLYEKERYEPRIICLLLPTSPFKTGNDVDRILRCTLDGCLLAYTVSLPQTNPKNIFLLDQNNGLSFSKCGEFKQHNDFFLSNLSINARFVPPWRLLEDKLLASDEFHLFYQHIHREFNRLMIRHKIIKQYHQVFIMDEVQSIDINTEADFKLAEAVLENKLFDFSG